MGRLRRQRHRRPVRRKVKKTERLGRLGGRSGVLDEKWQKGRTLRGNYAALGLTLDPNEGIGREKSDTSVSRKLNGGESTDRVVEKLEAMVAEKGVKSVEMAITGAGLQSARRPEHYMPEEEVKYMERLVAKYGTDTEQMFRDIKLNDHQKTRSWLNKKLKRFLLFTASSK